MRTIHAHWSRYIAEGSGIRTLVVTRLTVTGFLVSTCASEPVRYSDFRARGVDALSGISFPPMPGVASPRNSIRAASFYQRKGYEHECKQCG